MEQFVHLHNHSEFSTLDGCGLLTNIVKVLEEKEFPAYAITDHGSASGVLQFYNLCKKTSVKAILGSEMYFVDDNQIRPRSSTDIRQHLVEYDKKLHKMIKDKIKAEDAPLKQRDHITLLVKNETGYRNLMGMISDANLFGAVEGGFNRRLGRADWKLLEKYHEGLICLTACTSGVIARPIIKGIYDHPDINGKVGLECAESRLFRLKDIFGEDLYVEIMPLDMDDQKVVNPVLVRLANMAEVNIVATNDCHYINEDDADTHDVLLCIQTSKTIDDPDRWRFDARDLFLKTREQMKQSFLHRHPEISLNTVEESLDNTLAVAEKVDFKFPEVTQRLPALHIQEEDTYPEFLKWAETGGVLNLTDGLEEFAKKVIEEKEKEKQEQLQAK